MVTSLLTSLWVLAACGNGKAIDDARTLAENGQAELAIQALAGVLAAAPEERDAYVALGDIHFAAAQDSANEAPSRKDHYIQAAKAWQGAQGLGADDSGGLLISAAHARGQAGDRVGMEAALKDAWTCCQNTAALSLSRDASLKQEILSSVAWTPGAWTPHPSFASTPASERTRLVTGPQGAQVLPLDSTDPVRTLPPFTTFYGATRQADGHLFFTDPEDPLAVPRVGFVPWGYCKGRGNNTANPCEKGKQVSVRSPDIYEGPCWWMCRGGVKPAAKSDLARYERGSATCVGDGNHVQSDFETAVCKVEYNVLEDQERRIPIAAGWLMPAGTFQVPVDALKLSDELGLTDIRDHIGQGEFAVGLPVDLVDWAARGRPKVALRDGHLVETIRTTHGVFELTDGVLTSWLEEDDDAALGGSGAG